MQSFQEGEGYRAEAAVKCAGGRIVVSSFVAGLKASSGRPPVPLSSDAALDWAIRFAEHGYNQAAEEIFDKLCAGLTVYRY